MTTREFLALPARERDALVFRHIYGLSGTDEKGWGKCVRGAWVGCSEALYKSPTTDMTAAFLALNGEAERWSVQRYWDDCYLVSAGSYKVEADTFPLAAFAVVLKIRGVLSD